MTTSEIICAQMFRTAYRATHPVSTTTTSKGA